MLVPTWIIWLLGLAAVPAILVALPATRHAAQTLLYRIIGG